MIEDALKLTPDEHRKRLIDTSYSYLMDHRPASTAPAESRGRFVDAFLTAFNDGDPTVQRLATVAFLVNTELMEHTLNGAQLKPRLESHISFPEKQD